MKFVENNNNEWGIFFRPDWDFSKLKHFCLQHIYGKSTLCFLHPVDCLFSEIHWVRPVSRAGQVLKETIEFRVC